MARGARMSKSLRPISEKYIHSAVMAHWKACGVPGSMVATIPNMRASGQAGLTKGLPDLIIIAPGLPIGFLELKRKGGELSKHQNAFRDLCISRGIPFSVTYGRDEPITVLEAWGACRPSSSVKQGE